MLRTVSFALLLLAAPFALAGPYDAPAGYYSSATGTGSTLKGQLHNIIDNHSSFSYGSARSILQDTDVDPNDPNRMLLVYNRVSLNVSAINPNGSIPGWDSGNSWNREHTWPKSRGVGTSGPDTSDLHQLRPSNPSINSSRSNLNFGGEYGAQSYGRLTDGGVTKWYPGDEDAGMIARQQFYMEVRYDGSDGSTVNLNLGSGNPSGNSLGDLDRLIEWHYLATPDDFELRRNDVIYDDYQGNRNPFIDRPELVWSVFVDQQNDTQLTLSGGTSTGGGGSALDVDLGRVYVGGASPANSNVTLQKTGSDGTYYNVSTTGSATSTLTDQYNAFSMSGGGSSALSVGLSSSTATSGLKTGQVVIDNLDVTTGGGAGNGANDADDVIDISLAVLDQPVASFDAIALTTATTLDFGDVNAGGGTLNLGASFVNFAGFGAPSFASDLDFDSLFGTGDTGVLTTNLVASAGIEQSDSFLFDALLDTSIAGAFSATYTLNLSGEDLPGEQSQQLTLTLLANVLASLTGDYNNDGIVNAADYTVWQDSFGSTVDLTADGDGNGTIDAGDYTVWVNNFGTSSLAVAVPEPAAWLLSVLALTLVGSRTTRR